MTTEQNDDHGSADRGTIVESLDGLRPPPAAAPRHTMLEPAPVAPRVGPADAETREVRRPATDVEPPFVPTLRPPVPRLTILDDGDPATGQTVWLRGEATVIGRMEGDVTLPHDPLVSARHAEIARRGPAGAHRWLLRDLGSTNGTYVACTRAPLRPDRLLLVGGRRYRFRPPADATGGGDAWPALVEFGHPAAGRPAEIPLRGTSLVVGRAGAVNDAGIADPLVAAQAARVFLDATHAWQIEALPSRNGLWMQVMEVVLAPSCRFQIGEQRFLFVV